MQNWIILLDQNLFEFRFLDCLKFNFKYKLSYLASISCIYNPEENSCIDICPQHDDLLSIVTNVDICEPLMGFLCYRQCPFIKWLSDRHGYCYRVRTTVALWVIMKPKVRGKSDIHHEICVKVEIHWQNLWIAIWSYEGPRVLIAGGQCSWGQVTQ
jgi:hypothetical protein